MSVEVELPDLGPEGGDEATIVEWHVEEGDEVEEGDVLLEVECESGTVEVHAPCAGTILERTVEEDEVVRVGDVLAIMEEREGLPLDEDSEEEEP